MLRPLFSKTLPPHAQSQPKSESHGTLIWPNYKDADLEREIIIPHLQRTVLIFLLNACPKWLSYKLFRFHFFKLNLRQKKCMRSLCNSLYKFKHRSKSILSPFLIFGPLLGPNHTNLDWILLAETRTLQLGLLPSCEMCPETQSQEVWLLQQSFGTLCPFISKFSKTTCLLTMILFLLLKRKIS